MKLVKEAHASWRAEVVFITSNRQGNQEIMEGCKEVGIPAFVSQADCVRLMTADFVWGLRGRCGTSDGTLARPQPNTILFYLFICKPSIPWDSS
jgi:hypothetical protein